MIMYAQGWIRPDLTQAHFGGFPSSDGNLLAAMAKAYDDVGIVYPFQGRY